MLPLGARECRYCGGYAEVACCGLPLCDACNGLHQEEDHTDFGLDQSEVESYDDETW